MLASDMDGLGALMQLACIIFLLWLIAFVLFVANVYLTFAKNSSSFRIVNGQILGVYTILALVLFLGSHSIANELSFTLIFLVPLMVMVHFVCLLISVRRRRRRLANAAAAEMKVKQGQS